MADTDVPSLPDFEVIKKFIDSERKTIIRVNELRNEDIDYVREINEAKTVLEFVESVQTLLHDFFLQYPSLISLFNKDFLPLNEFFQRDNVLDLIFLDDCLFPEKEMFFFGQDGGISENVLDLHLKTIENWINEKKGKHETNQLLIKENFSLDIKSSAMECQCVACSADYKNRLREFVLAHCKDLISDTAAKIDHVLDHGELDEASHLYVEMQKNIDKMLHKIRYRLKRSTLNRLDSQIKPFLKENFTYPSPLALKREQVLMPFLRTILNQDQINDDLVEEDEFKKFFNQLGTHIWRNERYITREFKKLIKSVMILKRKDISGKILQEYIGEFWIHSQARTIKRKIIYHMGPTNSGKTYHAIEALTKAEKGCYLAPLRLLAAELYDTMNHKGVVTTLLTGEEVIQKEGATHYSSTIEMARLTEYFDCCVIDEIQMITDGQRGWAWTRALVNIFAEEIHLCGDPSVLDLIKKIVELCGDELEIKEYNRMTELKVEKKPVILGDLQKSDALIVFSRRNALRYKRDLERVGFKVSIVYGRLSPEVRREQARKFDSGETDIIVATDAISMGMNLPIRRIIFTTLSKFINSQEHPITDSEIKQIAGRAGRYQRFPVGFVNCLTKVEDGHDIIDNALSTNLEQKKKCMVGPDLDIFSQVNGALDENGLPQLSLSEFLRLFNTMTFQKPFYCVELKEMIELAEMVEDADPQGILSQTEIFGFACAPVNLGLIDHVQYYNWILNHYVQGNPITNDEVDPTSNDIDYLETSIKCVELYQWLSRHFNNKHFSYEEALLLENKGLAIDKLNTLLSNKIVPTCSSCGVKLPEQSKFNICEKCFKERRFGRRGSGRPAEKSSDRPNKRHGKKTDKSRGKGKKGRDFSKRKKKRGKS
jgi:ATP-dependent RNA helicase SUPV3L1/SUV3